MFESYNDIKSCPQKITGILFFCKSWRKITGNEHFGYKNNNKALSFIPSTRQIALFSLKKYTFLPKNYGKEPEPRSRAISNSAWIS
jgi:hypothetical protein